MKRSLFAAVAAASTVFTGMSTAVAQEGPAHFRPLEVWTCNYNDRKDVDDMNEVYQAMRDGPADGDYSGFHLEPYFVGSRAEDMDFIYIGVWETGSDMSDMDPANDDIEAAWVDTANCNGYLYASMRIQEFPEDAGGGDGPFVLTVSDCKIGKGRTAGQAIGALNRFNDYKVANGSTVPTFVWFPALGDGNADEAFDFKLAMSLPGMGSYGSFFNWYEDNAIYQTEGNIMEGLLDCDEARLYFGRQVYNSSE